MPYDPRMMQQIGRMGIGMMGGQPFQPVPPPPSRRDQPADQTADPSQDPDRPKQPPRAPPSLLEMMMSLGRMTPAQYAKAQSGKQPSSLGFNPTGAPEALEMMSPWAFLGGMGAGGRPPR